MSQPTENELEIKSKRGSNKIITSKCEDCLAYVKRVGISGATHLILNNAHISQRHKGVYDVTIERLKSDGRASAPPAKSRKRVA